ncbi:uncharacterized protein A4U43_C06F19340 [Asparagus officinalis]|uniref:OTU domain-containing protein n=1 Tax=Asparagus officinalis TaxID=4686 RepID=A0A5P1EQF6_ASPOF|nr:uncharacterized protein A4U43_C06F19340 [Asparagus officinalis]
MDNGGENSGRSADRNHETRDEMLSRHRKEIKELQNKEVSMKKAAAKGSKAEQKTKKKQVEDEISQLSSQLKAKHSEELASLGYNNEIEDQLSFHLRGASPYTYTELRKMAAKYMNDHASDFLPFFLSDNKVEVDSDGSPLERFKQYCEEVESTAAWGGQLELGALVHCLKKHILIYSGSFPDVEMGKEYKSESESSEFNPIRVEEDWRLGLFESGGKQETKVIKGVTGIKRNI